MVHGLSSLVSLVLRVLNLVPALNVQSLALEILKFIRQTAYHWIDLVREKADLEVNDKRKTYLAAKATHIALACSDTFNVEDLSRIFATPSDISDLFRCCMLIHDWKHTLNMGSDPLLPILYRRWQDLSRRSCDILTTKIVCESNEGLDLALQRIWAAYDSISRQWKTAGTSEYLLMAVTSDTLGRNVNLQMHFNILTGEFLVNGRPLARLPSAYESDSIYQCLFGRSQLSVMPSNIPGMEYSCQTQCRAHTVHLAMQSYSDSQPADMLVRANNENGTWELIPRRLLITLFPTTFVEEYVHWRDFDNRWIEFRPVKAAWISSNDNWRLKRNSFSDSWYLKKKDSHLVSITSETAKLISCILQPLEVSSRIHCILSRADSVLHIELPRLQLCFYLHSNSRSLRCSQYPGMEVASDQSLGCLTGLDSKLLLIHRKTHSKILLIPNGHVCFKSRYSHVGVTVEWRPETRIYAYSVDSQLGRLVDNGSLDSKLLLCYLYALTSYCIPDTLTRMTGIEKALSILRSASLRSFDRLGPEHAGILLKISKLTPVRAFYPSGLKVMQSVNWQSHLSYLTHHNAFYEEVATIINQHKQTSFLYAEEDSNKILLPPISKHLLNRDKIRMSSFRIAGFGAEDHTQTYDATYPGLTSCESSLQANKAFFMSKMVYDEIPRVRELTSEKTFDHLWNLFSTVYFMRGPSVDAGLPNIRYDASLCDNPIGFIVEFWCYIHQLIESPKRPNRFQLMIWLSTLAFANKTDIILLKSLRQFTCHLMHLPWFLRDDRISSLRQALSWTLKPCPVGLRAAMLMLQTWL
ncbi:uncharacterized protein N7511_005431 [Penicillium nucicola]|uniref:uncharacterized protein n=1 Tax=Penicillium nucicola TaxID=1850975 RepID=UPI0025455AC7|nr:uncharacterized protein N7511_005431 [Penicillium nucicola]KAJ5762049.1 hypothetical protein N7511_005431 [Penicillium nucicola]